MVIYDLVCSNQHLFEGWFKSKDEYDSQNAMGLVCCPVCDSSNVTKTVSAPNIGKTTRQQLPAVEADSNVTNPLDNPELNALGQPNLRFSNAPETLEMLRSFVEKNFEDVGNEFSEETRKMHYGETEERAIRGNATDDDIQDLEDEGIQTFSIPKRRAKKNLN